MALIIENISGALLPLDDIGIALPISGTIDLTIESDPYVVANSALVGGDLNALITSGSVVVKSPRDDVTNLTPAEGVIACRTHNQPPYRLMNLTGIAPETVEGIKFFENGIVAENPVFITGMNSSLWLQERGAGTDAVRLRAPVVIPGASFDLTLPDSLPANAGDVLTSDTAGILSWTTIVSAPDQNIWETITADTGSTTANTTTDNLTISGGTGITTSIVGDVLTIDSTAIAADTPTVFVGLTADVPIPLVFTNILWPTTHIENDIPTIEHDNTNTDRILIQETGLYFISFSMSIDADAGEETFTVRVLINDTTLVPGSLRVASEDDEINGLSNFLSATLTAGDYVTLQHQASGAGNTTNSSSNFCVMRASGQRGDVGPAGPGGGSPGGVDSNVQYNNGGVFGGNNAFNFNDAALQVDIVGNILDTQVTIGGQTQVAAGDTNATLYVEVTGGGVDDEAGRFFWNRGAGFSGWISYNYDGTAPELKLVDEDDDPSGIVFQTIGTGTEAIPQFDNRFATRGGTATATTGFSWQVNGTEVATLDTGVFDINSPTGQYQINGSPLVIDDLDDVDTTTTAPNTGDILQFDGADWVPAIGLRPTFCIFAEENSAVTVGANNYEYSFGNGAVNGDPDPSGIPIGVACTLISIGVSGRNTLAGTSTVSIAITNNGTTVATGGIASGTGNNAKVQDVTAVTPDTVNFAIGDTLQFLTASETGTLADVRVVAYFERTA